jgi:hypothetical protein
LDRNQPVAEDLARRLGRGLGAAHQLHAVLLGMFDHRPLAASSGMDLGLDDRDGDCPNSWKAAAASSALSWRRSRAGPAPRPGAGSVCLKFVDLHRFVPISDTSNAFPKQVTRLPEFRRAARRGATGGYFSMAAKERKEHQRRRHYFFCVLCALSCNAVKH